MEKTIENVSRLRVLETGTSPVLDASVLEPFLVGRDVGRLLFDFGVMVSLMKRTMLDQPVLDFGAGSGWISEYCARLGIDTVAFDIHKDLEACLQNRVACDRRIDASLLGYAQGDGHAMPFESSVFGHILCYDTLHHMHSYPEVFAEYFRVLKRKGRGIFVEPGARHSSSPETIAFVQAQKKSDPDWIERDVVLEEIDAIARSVGFHDGLSIVPLPHPSFLQSYSMENWSMFRDGNGRQRMKLCDQLAHTNYWERVIFYVDKP